MKINYNIQKINNVDGSGRIRSYVNVVDAPAMSETEMTEYIQSCCTLTQADVKAAMTALRNMMVSELTGGRRFCIPGIGYFSLSAHSVLGGEEDQTAAINGHNICVRNIRYQPEAVILEEVKNGCSFVRSPFAGQSSEYTFEEIADGVREYLSNNSHLTRLRLQQLFRLRKTKALQWLERLVENGVLRKEGPKNAPIYYLTENAD